MNHVNQFFVQEEKLASLKILYLSKQLYPNLRPKRVIHSNYIYISNRKRDLYCVAVKNYRINMLY